MIQMRLAYGRLFAIFAALYLLSLYVQHSRLPQHDINALLSVVRQQYKGNGASTSSITYKSEVQDKVSPNDVDDGNKHADPHHDKERIMHMLREMSVDPYSIDNETWRQVPTWKQVTEVWGEKPILHGLGSCKLFRESVPAKYRRIAVAGIFSTGTNLLAQLLQHNCGIPERIKWIGRRKRGHGMEWQVPWGKHNPFRYRGNHSVRDFVNDKRHPQLDHYLPAVAIRDPYGWMTSMCRHPYTLQWTHSKQNCPGMVKPNTNKALPLTARFGADSNRVPFDSLVDVWNVWYGEYFNETSIPVMMVRFEDLVFFPEQVTRQVCECAGGEILPPLQVDSDKEATIGDFHYVVGTSLTGPGHGRSYRNGMVDAWIKYAKPRKGRQEPFSKSDLDFSEQFLNKDMVSAFHYDR